MPNGIAATRKLLGMPSAGVVMNHSSIVYSTACGSSASSTAATTTRPKASMKLRRRSEKRLTNRVSRRCSLRSSAIAEPSIATQMKLIEQTSSIQMTGKLNR